MHPVFLKIGDFTIHWYGVCMAFAFLIGFLHWVWLGRRDGRDAQFCSDLLFWVMLAGILGGRAAYVLSEWSYYAADPKRMLFFWEGGLIYYGGFVGAVAAIVIFARTRQASPLQVLDLAMVPLPLAHAIGRLGCLMNGCCFGDLCRHWPAIQFPAHSLPWYRQVELHLIDRTATQALPIHPVQLYEAGANALIYLFLLFLFRRRASAGTVTAMYLILYPISRFLLEFLRGTERQLWGGVPVAQVLSLGLCGLGVCLLLILRLRARRHPAST